jgi:hypothetical protein
VPVAGYDIERVASALNELATYTEPALAVVDDSFAAIRARLEETGEQFDPVDVALGIEIACLSAGEFALLRTVTTVERDPNRGFGRITVERQDAQLAVLKSNTGLGIPLHAWRGKRTLLLHDLTVFSSEISKLGPREVSLDDVTDLVHELEGHYAESASPLAQQIAAARAIPFQGLMWRLKLELATHEGNADLRVAIADHMTRFF